jgi:hypothetical protein
MLSESLQTHRGRGLLCALVALRCVFLLSLDVITLKTVYFSFLFEIHPLGNCPGMMEEARGYRMFDMLWMVR